MTNLAETLLTLGKVIVKSRPVEKSDADHKGKRLVIMGNGPSLRDTLDESRGVLESHDTMAVNFAANTPEYFMLRPRHYILADPHFFKGEELDLKKDPNVETLWSNLRKTDWEMTLHVPAGCRPAVPYNVRVRHFNMTPAEGSDALCHALFRRGLAMPRPRNVLIPAIMEGIRDGYSEIWLVGADHTWPHTLYVDDLNRVVSVQPHFYEDNRKELDRVAAEYAGIHIHDVLGSMTVAFRSYHDIRRYADREGVGIFNATPGSLIDAFTRRSLKDLE